MELIERARMRGTAAHAELEMEGGCFVALIRVKAKLRKLSKNKTKRDQRVQKLSNKISSLNVAHGNFSLFVTLSLAGIKNCY